MNIKFYFSDLLKDLDRYFSLLEELIQSMSVNTYTEVFFGYVFDLIILINQKYQILPSQRSRQTQICYKWLCLIDKLSDTPKLEGNDLKNFQLQIMYFINSAFEAGFFKETVAEHMILFDKFYHRGSNCSRKRASLVPFEQGQL